MSDLAAALAGGTRFAKWSEQGDQYSGRVIRAEVRQATKFQSDQPDTWDDGTAKNQVVIAIATTLKEDDDDQGERAVVVNLWGKQKAALSKACKDAGVKEPLPGMTLTAQWTGGVGGASDPRRFAYTLDGAAAAELNVETTAETPAPVGDDWEAQVRAHRAAGKSDADIADALSLPPAVVASVPNF